MIGKEAACFGLRSLLISAEVRDQDKWRRKKCLNDLLDDTYNLSLSDITVGQADRQSQKSKSHDVTVGARAHSCL